MELQNLIARFSDTTEHQCKAIFSTLFIAGNRLQTLFDQQIPEISLKQFMLLTMLRQSPEACTFTQLGKLLGCSRQNIKKLAIVLEKKGFVTIQQSQKDVRAASITPTEKLKDYFETVFASYESELRHVFAVYTPAEIAQFFHLMMKLYDGIDRLENHTKTAVGRDTACVKS